MKASYFLAIAFVLTAHNAWAAQATALAVRADQYIRIRGAPLDQRKPDSDGVIRSGIDIQARFVGMSADMLAKEGFKTQSEAWVHEDVCDADLIAVATATSAVSDFSASRKMIFTLVSFDNVQILRAKRSVRWREPLVIMAMWGDLFENGQRYVFTNNRDLGYNIGTQYLLKLRLDESDPTLFHTMGYWPQRIDGSLIASTRSTTPNMFTSLKADLARVLAQGDCRD